MGLGLGLGLGLLRVRERNIGRMNGRMNNSSVVAVIVVD